MFFLMIMGFFTFFISGIHFAMVGDYVSSFASIAVAALTAIVRVILSSIPGAILGDCEECSNGGGSCNSCTACGSATCGDEFAEDNCYL